MAAAVAMAVVAVTTVAARAGDVHSLTYKLKVGQEYVYEGSTQIGSGPDSVKATDRTTFWVTRLNDDGSWHLVACVKHTAAATRTATTADATGSAAAQAQDEDALGSFELFPDGRIAGASAYSQEERLGSLFIKLAADDAEAQGGWSTPDPSGATTSYRSTVESDAAAGRWVFEGRRAGGSDDGLIMDTLLRVEFDGARGVVTKFVEEDSFGAGLAGGASSMEELKSVRDKDSQWLDQLSRETVALDAARDFVQEEGAAVGNGACSPREALEKARKQLADARRKVKLGVVTDQFDAMIAQVEESSKMFGGGETAQTLLNKPAPDWMTSDLDGNQHALDEYKGRVLILDFWDKNCALCVLDIPQVMDIARHYAGKLVAVVGVNTDPNENDARLVMEALKVNYPMVRGAELAEKYKTCGCPMLVVIDAKGIVRGCFAGNSAVLREEAIKTVDGLFSSDD
ncbi:MAG TPA: TlpA disulfide reductase family protein [Chthoniobacteraceae bacterium]|nr:TlpA disulfide reductase family protein [Chthoniobacteraceae bacterium]